MNTLEELIGAAKLSIREEQSIRLFESGVTSQRAMGAAMECSSSTAGVYFKRARAKLTAADARLTATKLQAEQEAREAQWRRMEIHHYCTREIAVFLIECVGGPASHRDHGPQIGRVQKCQDYTDKGTPMFGPYLLSETAKVNAGCPVTAEDLMGPAYEVESALEVRLTQTWVQDRERQAA